MPEFKFNHNNINVLDLEKSLNFYKKALGLIETKVYEPEDKSFKLVYLGDGTNPHRLELTWLKDRKEPYNLGENEFHIAFTTDNFEAAYELHKQMNCICYENKDMGIYFISDPDNYWLEIVPEKKMK
jgi:lactoylglutathione lyase